MYIFGINAIFNKLGIHTPNRNRGIQAIRDIQIVDVSEANVPIEPSQDSESNEEPLEEEMGALEQDLGKYNPTTNQITIFSPFPDYSKQNISDVALHEAIHAMATHYDTQRERWICGFGTTPRTKRELTEGFTEWLRRLGSGFQRGADDSQWGTGYSPNYLVAVVIAKAVGEQNAAQKFLDGDYDGLNQDLINKTHGRVSLDILCRRLEIEQSYAEEEQRAKQKLRNATTDFDRNILGRRFVLAHSHHFLGICRLKESLVSVSM